MQWDEETDLRNSAICVWSKFLTGNRSADILRVRDYLDQLGYRGLMGSSSADSILEGWMKAGWIQLSPNRAEIRLKADGEEQLARWQEEDRLWRSGETGELELPKRLKAGEPATNLRRICQVIGRRTIECIHDPYTDEQALRICSNWVSLGLQSARAFAYCEGQRRG